LNPAHRGFGFASPAALFRRVLRTLKKQTMKRIPILIAVCAILPAAPLFAAERVLDAKFHHLRSGATREWADFPGEAEGPELAITFTAARNAAEMTLRLRQNDVKVTWRVALNGKVLGRLTVDENDQITLFKLPPGALAEGDNTLTITTADPARLDDIRVGDVRLIDRPLDKFTADGTVELDVIDETGAPTPCRLTIVDGNGSLAPVGAKSDDRLAVRTGMVYTADGSAKFGLAAGPYTITAGRGPRHSIATTTVTIEPGKAFAQRLTIRREVATAGWIAVDTHIHTLTFSRHGDATAEERVITIAGEGIDLAVCTDHNIQVDFEPYARKTGTRKYFTPVIGNEVTTKVGHFNAFPAPLTAKLPNDKAKSWPEIFDGIAATPGIEIVTLNHPADLHGIRVFDPKRFNGVVGKNLDGWKLRANAVEVVTSAAMQTDGLRLFHDWFGLLNRGLPVTPIGCSDSHEVSRFLLGQGRTYVRCPDGDPGNVDVKAAYRSLREGRVGVSLGLFVEMTVGGKFGPGDVLKVAEDRFRVDVVVQGPTWMTADHVALYANGVKIREEVIAPPAGRPGPIKWTGGWTLPRPAHDVYLVAIATGPGVTAPYWRMPRPYQPTSIVWKPYVLGATGAVWVDADGDGKSTGAFEYARRLVNLAGGDAKKTLEVLARFDEAVAAQAADILCDGGLRPDDAVLAAALNTAEPAVKRGFERYFAAARIAAEKK
jgi:hypothetical protein